jgi:hypothetical protein
MPLPLHAVRVQRCGHLALFLNEEPSKTAVWLPCSGHVQEQKRLPPRLADMSPCGSRGSRQRRGFLLRARLCLVMHACLCLCRFRQRGQHVNACLLVFVLHACLCPCSGLCMHCPFLSLCLCPCAPCMFNLSCPAHAWMPGIVLCLALLAHAGPALGPSLPSSCSIPAGLAFALSIIILLLFYYSWNGGRAEAVCAGGKGVRMR